MICYQYGTLLKKKWCWFENPREIHGCSMVNFFSYNKVDMPGFRVKSGLTSVIDLNVSIENLWNNLRKSFIREQIKRGENSGIVAVQGGDFDAYTSLDKVFRRKKGLPRYSLTPFKKCGLLFTAHKENELLAGAVAISDGIYMRALVLSSLHGVNKEKQNVIGQANRMVMWEMIKYAKSTDHQLFDLGGIDVDNESNPSSLTLFKEAFGGVRKENYFYYKVYSKILQVWIKYRTILPV